MKLSLSDTKVNSENYVILFFEREHNFKIKLLTIKFNMDMDVNNTTSSSSLY